MRRVIAALVCVSLALVARADSVNFTSGRAADCTVLQETADHVAVLYGSSVIRVERSMIASLDRQQPSIPQTAYSRTPDFRTVAARLGAESWAADLHQIPATVIDKGNLRNVPYKSLRAGGDYEINVYGDPESPAGFEVGVYRGLLDDAQAKKNCRELVCALLGDRQDVAAVRGLREDKDLVVRDGLTLEITPPAAEDAYKGWWVSVYNRPMLDAQRASEKEMAAITVAKSSITRSAKPAPGSSASGSPQTSASSTSSYNSQLDQLNNWTPDDLRYARVYRPVVRPVYYPVYYVRGYARSNGAYVPQHPHVSAPHPHAAPHHR
jgi:hypothetical protein